MQRRVVFLGVSALAFGVPASAAEWLTVHGFPEVESADLIEVDPVSDEVGGMPLVRLRVSRNEMRTSFQGHRYRSYRGTALIDCARLEGWYQSCTYYQQPGWQGNVSARETYASNEAPMLFKDIPGNAVHKIVQAACKLKSPR